MEWHAGLRAQLPHRRVRHCGEVPHNLLLGKRELEALKQDREHDLCSACEQNEAKSMHGTTYSFPAVRT